MLLQNVLEELEQKFNIRVAKSTLRNYQIANLIPQGKRSSLGRGQGTVTEYPDNAVAEIYAAYMLLNDIIRTTPEMIAEARKIVLKMENEEPDASVPHNRIVRFVCEMWLYYRELALTGDEYFYDFKETEHGARIVLLKYPRKAKK